MESFVFWIFFLLVYIALLFVSSTFMVNRLTDFVRCQLCRLNLVIFVSSGECRTVQVATAAVLLSNCAAVIVTTVSRLLRLVTTATPSPEVLLTIPSVRCAVSKWWKTNRSKVFVLICLLMWYFMNVLQPVKGLDWRQRNKERDRNEAGTGVGTGRKQNHLSLGL